MKTYQIYAVAEFPEFQLGETRKSQAQYTMFGETQDVQAVVTKVAVDMAGFEQYRVRSSIRINAFGIIRFFDTHRREMVDRQFNEYLRPVDFSAFVLRDEKFVAFQCPQKHANEVRSQLNGSGTGIQLTEKKIDFDKVRAHHDAFAGAWFRKVSANIRAEGLHGTDVQDDPRFKELLQIAELSNLILRYDYQSVHHNVMITKHSAVVFQHVYPTVETELLLLKSVKQAILQQAWV